MLFDELLRSVPSRMEGPWVLLVARNRTVYVMGVDVVLDAHYAVRFIRLLERKLALAGPDPGGGLGIAATVEKTAKLTHFVADDGIRWEDVVVGVGRSLL